MRFHILSIFPEMFAPLEESILKRARQNGIIEVNLINFRDFAYSKHHNVDDYPYGGGAGMVLKPEPIFAAVRSITAKVKAKVVLMTPQGRVFNQQLANSLAREKELIIVCGHYEGYDERIRTLADYEISIGDYVLTGGELAAMVVVDAVARLIPGVLGREESFACDTFFDGMLEYPQYTRPPVFEGMEVPPVLLSGDHSKVAEWRRKEALRRTLLRRREIFDPTRLSATDFLLLRELMAEEEEIRALSHLWLSLEPPPQAQRAKTARRKDFEQK